MDPVMAQVIMFAGNFAPRDWAYCDGSLQSIAENSALFSLLGTTYGGDGQNTFALPDFRGRVAVGTGAGSGRNPRTLGEMGGSETVTLTTGNLPAHNHPATATVQVGVTNVTANSDDPDGSLLTTTGAAFYATGAGSGHLGGVTASASTGLTGNNQPVGIMSPYLAMNYIICLYGIYPSRN